MFKKTGRYLKNIENEQSCIENPKGEKFKVNFLSLFIWNSLDGNNSIEMIAKDIEKTSKVINKELPVIVLGIIHKLEEVDLVKKVA